MYEVIWPGGKRVTDNVPIAKRLDTLAGKTVGVLWDWLFHGDKVFPEIEKELARRYRDVRFVSYEVFGSTHGGEEAKMLAALPNRLKQNECDAVISGIGC